MIKNFVKFINHASILISNSNKSVLTDPWYSGSVFDDGWSLLYENLPNEIEKLLEQVNFIWFSHEHPDHFSVKFLNDFEKIIKKNKIKFIFQKTKDRRVISYLKFKEFDFIELDNNEIFNIDKNFTLKIQKCDFYDSALIVNLNGKKIFNLNDCPLKTKSEILKFKKKHGECDFLFTQFSYAAWKGGEENLKWRQFAAEEKIKTLKYQSEILNSKFTVPFASFIKFCDKYNYYLNDSVNSPVNILQASKNIKSNILFLAPFQEINLDNPKKDIEGYIFWKKIYDDKNNFNINENIKNYSFESLKIEFDLYKNRIFNQNSKILIKLISKIKFLSFFQPLVIALKDLKINIKIDLPNEIFEVVKIQPDIEMNSKSLHLIFKQDFGFDTLTVNGCFQEKKINGFTKMSKNFAIGNLNNLGIKFDYKIMFNFTVIILFLKKLLYVKKRLV